MNVECNFFGPLREAVGQKTVEREIPDGATVRELLEDLSEDYDVVDEQILEDGEVAGSVTVTVNGSNVKQLDGAATRLEDGDVLRFSPPITGGSA